MKSFSGILLLLIAVLQVRSQSPSNFVITGTVLPGGDAPTRSVSYFSPTSTRILSTSGELQTGISSGISGSLSGSNTSETSTAPLLTIIGGQGTPTTGLNGTVTSSSASAVPTNTQPCNNYPEFCVRRYSNVTEVCAHNSPFVRPGNAASNQYLDVISQLNDGVRMLQGQAHYENETLFYCHTSCDLLNAGTVEDYLRTVTSWVQTHPYDVITILFGNYDQVDPRLFAEVLDRSGLMRYVYGPPQIPMGLDDWPTLGEMILRGRRVVIFLDYNADQERYPYILDEFSQIWETPFSPQDINFPCTVDRPPNSDRNSSENKMYIANHNLNVEFTLGSASFLLPNTADLVTTNGLNGTGSLGLAAERCTADWGRAPNFLLVDFYNTGPFNGSVFEVAARANNVTYDRPCCGSAARSAGTVGSPKRSTYALILYTVLAALLLGSL